MIALDDGLSPDKQVTNMQQLLAQKVNAIVFYPLDPKATVPVLTVCMLVGNSARVWFSRHDIVWRVVAAFLVGAVPMTMLGATLYTSLSS